MEKRLVNSDSTTGIFQLILLGWMMMGLAGAVRMLIDSWRIRMARV